MVAKGDGVHDLPIQLDMNSPLMGEVPMAIEGLSRLKYSLWSKKLGTRKSIGGACYRCPAHVAKRSGSTFRYEMDASRCELPVMCDAESKIGSTVYVRDGSERFLKPEIKRFCR